MFYNRQIVVCERMRTRTSTDYGFISGSATRKLAFQSGKQPRVTHGYWILNTSEVWWILFWSWELDHSNRMAAGRKYINMHLLLLSVLLLSSSSHCVAHAACLLLHWNRYFTIIESNAERKLLYEMFAICAVAVAVAVAQVLLLYL